MAAPVAPKADFTLCCLISCLRDPNELICGTFSGNGYAASPLKTECISILPGGIHMPECDGWSLPTFAGCILEKKCSVTKN